MVPCERFYHIWNIYVQYDSPITSGLKVMAKVKVFVHASHTHVDMDANADAGL